MPVRTLRRSFDIPMVFSWALCWVMTFWVCSSLDFLYPSRRAWVLWRSSRSVSMAACLELSRISRL